MSNNELSNKKSRDDVIHPEKVAAVKSFFSNSYKPQVFSPTFDMAIRLARWGVPPVRCCGFVESPDGGVECQHDSWARGNARKYGKADYKRCQSPGKRPYNGEWQNYLTTDLDVIRDEWKGWRKHSNVGFGTGSASGLAIIDIDGEAGFKSLAALEEKFGKLPKTVLSITGSGGHHYLFRIPEGVTIHNSAKLFGAKALGVESTNIDIRGQGGQAIAPSSMHKSGNRYAFADGCSIDDFRFEDVPFLPDWAVEACEHAKASSAKTPTKSPAGKGKAGKAAAGTGDAFQDGAADMASDTAHGLEGFLASIGDDGAGFDSPIYKAAMSYFARNGISASPDIIRDKLKEAILGAECKDDRAVTRYAADAYLIPRIEQARVYIEANPPQRRRSQTLFDSFPEGIAALNAKTAIVHLAGKTRLLRENADGTVDFPSKHDAELTYLPWKVMTKKKETRAVSAPLVDVEAPLFPVWMQSSDRREYASVTFDPSEKSPQDGSSPEHVFNLWRGFSIEPAPEGVGSWRLYARHVFNVIANAHEAQFLWVCAFMADMLQNPATKPGSAIVLSGIPGCGKTIICMPFKRILETHMTTVSDEASLAGNFNAHMAKALLVNGEEAFFAGNHQVAGKVKHLITGSTIMLEHKGIDKVEIPNFSRFIYTSNEGRIVFVDKNDRRNYVSGCGAQHVGDKEGYFDPLVAEIKGDGPAAMMRDLLALDISDVALNLPPRTEAFGEQVAENMTQPEKWLMEVLETGTFPQRENYDGVQPTSTELEKWETEGLTVDKQTIFDSFNSKVRVYGGGEMDKRSIGKFLSANIVGLSSRRATGLNGARPWVFGFPPLGKLRETFTRETHIRLGVDREEEKREITAADLRDPFFSAGYVMVADAVIDALFGRPD
ncbi:MAG: bifunctional DNA primase/polymerase [Methylocystis sp.]